MAYHDFCNLLFETACRLAFKVGKFVPSSSSIVVSLNPSNLRRLGLAAICVIASVTLVRYVRSAKTTQGLNPRQKLSTSRR